jgi:Bacterial inner membrane protein
VSGGPAPAEWLGWVATAVFAASYFFTAQRSLRLVQALGAALWISYGIVIGAAPVVAANLVVGGIALVSAVRRRPSVR